MIRYLIDSSALWRMSREPETHKAWQAAATTFSIGSCHPQRVEFRRSAKDHAEFDRMTDMFEMLYPDVPVHKSCARWVETTQYRLAARGLHKGLSLSDLTIAATAAHHGLVVLHDDNDFRTIADAIGEPRHRYVRDFPEM